MSNKSSYTFTIIKSLALSVVITNSGFANLADNIAGRDVEAHIKTQASDGIPDYEHTWPDAVKPSNVWWVPLEYGFKAKDVYEALVKPLTINGWQGYSLEIGSKRKPMTSNDFYIAEAVGKSRYRPANGSEWNCTATHVGNGYVVTAGHCIPDPKITPDACSALTVEWDYRRPRKDFPKVYQNTRVGQCQEIISWEMVMGSPTTIDHAIFRVDNAPDAKVDIESKPKLANGSYVHQFSHPGGVKLVWSESCQITDRVFQYYKHDCWSASGSSGSALIDKKTRRLVGVLSMGQDTTFFSTRNDVSPIGCFDVNTGKVNTPC